MATPLSAASAYQSQLKMMQGMPQGGMEETGNQPSFMDMVKTAAEDAAGAIHKGENLQMASIATGKVELTNLVTAVANAELSLNTVVAIRDRVISAYQDIIKMAI